MTINYSSTKNRLMQAVGEPIDVYHEDILHPMIIQEMNKSLQFKIKDADYFK